MTDVTTSALADALRDRYTLERELGRGGMATVYLAHDLKHDRKVALKVLRPELAAVVGAERFLREIRLTAQLQHPHIVTLIDSGEAGGTLYYVLPYIEGESLRQRLTREGQLPLDDVVRIARVVSSALQYAHDQGVIHRDIKPENILFSRGEPIVADFGIALAAASVGRERLTETGLSLGTPAYMSPEQASAEQRLDGRTDQYSLACVVYEMLTGEPPYTGPTAQAIIAKRLSEPVPRLSTLRQVPVGLETAVTRALAKQSADRFGSMAEFVAALALRTAPRRRLTRRSAALLGGLAVLSGLALLAWLFRPAPAPRPMVTRQLTYTGTAGGPSLSPNGKWAAYLAGDSLMVQELSSSRPAFVAFATAFDEPKWSPDGASLLFQAQDSDGVWLYTVPRLGGVPRRVVKSGLAAFSYTTDGRQVEYNKLMSDSIFIADINSGEVVRRIALSPKSYMAWRVPISPGGQWIAFGGERGGIPYLGVISMDGLVTRRLVDWVDRGAIQWNPRGDAIYFFQRVPGGADLMKVRIDPKSGERRGSPVLVMSQAPFTEYSVGADGRTLLYQKESSTSQVWTLTVQGPPGKRSLQARQLTTGTARHGSPAISPDGRWVVYAQDEVTERNLYIVPYTGGPARLVGATRSDRLHPRWAADSRHLAFGSADSSGAGISIADIEKGHLRQHHGSSMGLAFSTLAWSPDGKHLLFSSEDPGRFIMLDVDSDQETGFAPPRPIGWLFSPLFSPDGQEVVIAAIDEHFRGNLWRVTLATGEWRPVAGGDSRGVPLLWSRDGWVYVLRGRGDEIWRMAPSGQSQEMYARITKPCDWWSLPPLDDRATRLVCTVEEVKSDIWIATDFDPGQRE